MQMTMDTLKLLQGLDKHSFTAKLIKLMGRGDFSEDGLDPVDSEEEVVLGELTLEEKALRALSQRYNLAMKKIGYRIYTLMAKPHKTAELMKFRATHAHCEHRRDAANKLFWNSVIMRLGNNQDGITLAIRAGYQVVLITQEEADCDCPVCRQSVPTSDGPFATILSNN